MTAENFINTPPSLPVRRPANPIIAPPRPPLPPGAKPLSNTISAPPRPPSAAIAPPKIKPREAEVARRREALAEAGTGDPKSTASMMGTAIKNSAKSIPLLLKKYWWLALIIGVGWLLLAIWEPIGLAVKYPALRGVINFLTPIIGVLILVTAAYNNWVARSLYALIVFKVGIPLVQRIRKEGIGPVFKSFASVVPGLKSNWSECAVNALPVYIGMVGVGLALSNFLTRNNSSDKVLVSIALAISLVKTLSDGKKSMPFMATRVISRDIFKLVKKDNSVKNHHIYLGIGGVMTGLLGAIVLMLTRNLPQGDFLGYFLGAAVFIGVVVVYFVKARKKATADSVQAGN